MDRVFQCVGVALCLSFLATCSAPVGQSAGEWEYQLSELESRVEELESRADMADLDALESRVSDLESRVDFVETRQFPY